MNKFLCVSAVFLTFTALSEMCLSNGERTRQMNDCLEEARHSSNLFLKQAAEQEFLVRQAIPQENEKAFQTLQDIIAKTADKDELQRQTLECAEDAVGKIQAFYENTKNPIGFPGRTLTYGSLKLECLVPGVKAFLGKNFEAFTNGDVLEGYHWDPHHVAELDNLSEETMNGHMRTSVWAAALDQVAFAASTQNGLFQSLYDHAASPQVYKVYINENDVPLLRGTLYDGGPIVAWPTVQSYGVYAWGGLRDNPLYPQGKLGQKDCCAFIQESLTAYTQDAPPSAYSTTDLRKCSLRLRGKLDERTALLDYLCDHFTDVPTLSERKDKDLSQVKPGDVLLLRRGDAHPDSGLGTGGHVSIVTGFWQNNPIVLEYNRDREGTGMDGFGCSVKDVLGDDFGGYTVLRPTALKI